jgi:hypothetical protein
MNRVRFLAKSYGDNIDGTKAGLAKLLELLRLNTYKSATIVVPVIGDVKYTILVPALGEELAKVLIRDRTITLSDGKKLSLCGHATLKNFKYEDAYLGLWASKDTIAAIEKLPTWKGAVVVTWLPTDAEDWIKDHSVKVIYDDGRG